MLLMLQVLFRIDNNPVETFGNEEEFAAVGVRAATWARS
jgi:hypothetical protein